MLVRGRTGRRRVLRRADARDLPASGNRRQLTVTVADVVMKSGFRTCKVICSDALPGAESGRTKYTCAARRPALVDTILGRGWLALGWISH
jgi:hypothetical protein